MSKTLNLREWQEQFVDRFVTHTGDFLLVACPGAGKTIATITAFNRSECDRLIVVVPTEHLKHQWSRAAAKLGVELLPDINNRNNRPPSDADGFVFTYAQVAASEELHRRFASRAKTMVALDEVHHCGGEKSWGRSIRYAYGPAARRLAMSGTPFRSDDEPIPFVTYDDGVSQADYTYDYGQAVHDRVCRSIFFPQFEGEMKWSEYGDKEVTAKFSDAVDDIQLNRRLRTALVADGEWLNTVISKAHRALMARREATPRAGGLILAIDQTHAKAIAGTMRATLGVVPTVVISEDPNASKHIDTFSTSSDPWIVAVQMVSEGVDIPRLDTLVYATVTTSELFFRQAAGRISRGDGTAHFYIPKDARLVAMAEAIREEREHAIKTREVAERDPSETTSDGVSFMPLNATSAELVKGCIGDDEYSAGELFTAEAQFARFGIRADPLMAAQLIRAVKLNPGSKPKIEPAPVLKPKKLKPASPNRSLLKAQHKKLIGKVGREMTKNGSLKNIGEAIQEMTVTGCVEALGVFVKKESMTISQLERVNQWFRRKLSSVKGGNRAVSAT